MYISLTEYVKPGTPEADTGPSAAAVTAYRELVQSYADVDQDVLRDAWRTQGDFTADRHTWEQRKDAADTLAVRVPQLEAELRDAKAAAAVEQSIASRPVADFPTVGALVEAIERAMQERNPAFVTPARNRVRDVQGDLSEERRRSIDVLRRTSSVETARRLADLHNRIKEIEGQVNRYQQLADLDSTIAKQSELCDALAESRNDKDKPKYREARAKLAELSALRPQVPEAIKAVVELQGTLVDLHRQFQEAEQSRLDPRNQLWSV